MVSSMNPTTFLWIFHFETHSSVISIANSLLPLFQSRHNCDSNQKGSSYAPENITENIKAAVSLPLIESWGENIAEEAEWSKLGPFGLNIVFILISQMKFLLTLMYALTLKAVFISVKSCLKRRKKP